MGPRTNVPELDKRIHAWVHSHTKVKVVREGINVHSHTIVKVVTKEVRVQSHTNVKVAIVNKSTQPYRR